MQNVKFAFILRSLESFLINKLRSKVLKHFTAVSLAPRLVSDAFVSKIKFVEFAMRLTSA